MSSREAFEAWCEDYGLQYEPNYSEGTKADCLAAWVAATERAAKLCEDQRGLSSLPGGDRWTAVAAAIRS